jgi:DNA-binding CsgD family transcriptional regulator/tetratricopeptide (TPR) repeat protein
MLLEREKELGLLVGFLEDIGQSGGKVVLIRGEAGIGKSSLVKGLLASVGDSAHVYLGFCDDLQTPQPFGPLWDVSREEPGLSEALRASDRQQVMETLFDLLSRSLKPNLMVIEDTHWSDEATLDAVKYVGRRIARTNGLLVLTFRDEEVDPDNPLRTVLGALPSGSVERVQLKGLSRAAVAEIVAESGLDPDVVLETTRGNPFFVTEMAMTAGDEVPSSVRDSVMARVGRLSILGREMLRYMSVVPERTTRDELAALLGSVENQVVECERFGLLDVGAETVAFRHELIRRVIEASLTTTESIAIHQALLDVLPDDTDPARLVHHARGANDVERLIEVGPLAARAAAGVASHREAAAHYRTLEPYMELLPQQEQARVLTDWARMEYYLANVEAIDILDRAIGMHRLHSSARELADALGLAVAVNETHGKTAAAESYAREAIKVLEPEGASAELAEAHSRYADLLLHQGEGRRADVLVDRAIAMGEATGSELAQIRALIVKGMLAYVRGQARGRDLVEEARRRAEEGNYRYEEVTALRSLAYSGQEQDDIDLQQDVAQRARATAIRYELSFLEAEANAVHADALLRRGKWAQAEDLVTENIGSHANADVHLMRVLGLLRLRRGRAGARPNLENAWRLAEESGEIDYVLHVSSALAEEKWLVGGGEGEWVERQRDLVNRGIKHEFPWLAGTLAFWLWMLGELGRMPDGLPLPHAQAIEGHWAEAAEHWQRKGMPYEQAVVLSSGDRDARLRSLEILDSLGAEAVAAKVRKDLRDEGVTVPRGKGRATREHVAGLTARQAEVLELLGEGLSNPEIADRLFLSPRTVENHVSAILAKLNTATREEAVTTARSQDLL